MSPSRQGRPGAEYPATSSRVRYRGFAVSSRSLATRFPKRSSPDRPTPASPRPRALAWPAYMRTGTVRNCPNPVGRSRRRSPSRQFPTMPSPNWHPGEPCPPDLQAQRGRNIGLSTGITLDNHFNRGTHCRLYFVLAEHQTMRYLHFPPFSQGAPLGLSLVANREHPNANRVSTTAS